MKKTIPSILVLLILSCATLKQSGKELLKNNKNIEIIENKNVKYLFMFFG